MTDRFYKNIPLATPYPWGPNEEEDAAQQPVSKKKQALGSGYAALHSCLENPKVSNRSKAILEGLLSRDGKLPSKDGSTAVDTTTWNNLDTDCSRIPATASQTHDELVEMAQQGGGGNKISLFLSLLKVVEESSSQQPVSTRHLLRTCSLTVNPGEVPPHMDCKEMVLGALHFLSSKFDLKGEESSNHEDVAGQRLVETRLTKLPLIRAVQEVEDLEKRSFEKHGEWSLSSKEFCNKVLTLEKVFGTSSCAPYKCLGRQRFCPRGLPADQEKLLMLKGTLGKNVGPKKRKAAAVS